MDSSIPDKFEEEYQEIKALVTSAKEAEDDKNFKKAKSYFLDAATKALSIAKLLDEIEQVTFRNIARILVDNAKEMQMLLEIQKNPLPSIPGQEPKTQPKPDIKPKELLDKKNEPILLQLMIIQESGLPIYTITADSLDDKTQVRINDVLFSGAITAVNSLIAEVLSKPIQSINIDDGTITLKFVDDMIFVVFSKGDPSLLETSIDKFSSDFCNDILPRVKGDVKQGKALNGNPDIDKLVNDCFKLSK